ncbi:MAG: FixH family protein [Devosiaceae bacterium]|nr:FixH family protein [Devosiaceae bacterium MH13]
MSVLDAGDPPTKPTGLGHRLFGEHRWIPWLFVLGFLVLFAVTGTFVTLALSTFTGLVSTNAYERGLAYDEVIEAERAQEARGWQMALDMPALSGDGQQAAITLTDRNGEALAGATVVMLAERMTRYAQQVRVSLTDQGDGLYAAPISFPISGRWLISVLADIGGERHFETTEIYLNAPGVNED